jgi:hypothetical protein
MLPTCLVSRDSGRKRRDAYHLVDGFHNGKHLLVGDLAVAVNVVEVERPVELVLHLAAARHAEGDDEFLKVNGARPIRVEDFEHIVGEC